MGQIRMTPDMMRTRANEYRTQGSMVHEVIDKMQTLLTELQGEWEGAASQSYAERYEEIKPQFLKAETLIGEIATALDQAANIVEETDNSMASQFRG